MKETLIHRIILTFFALTTVAIALWLIWYGYGYYTLPLEERPFHPLNQTLKASGFMGHGLGIMGSLLILTGVSTYMIRKRFRSFSRFGMLKHWLEFHIFLCTLGPILVLFHTTFKFGGIVAVSFWSMVTVLLSGIAGRYVYLQIPRTIEGNELTMNELEDQLSRLKDQVQQVIPVDDPRFRSFQSLFGNQLENNGVGDPKRNDHLSIKRLKTELKAQKVSPKKIREIVDLIQEQLSLRKKIARLFQMQRLFSYWHVAHLPFALIMLVVMIVHVLISVTFGYKWIF
ncbi:MAG: hypothetical protein LWW85_12340 [Marinilabiliales bacterium]|nr:hypothetical protein [Marinilabiliales bacterium]